MRRSDRLTGSKRPNGSSAAGVTDAANQPRPTVTDLPGTAGLPGTTDQPAAGDHGLASTAVETSAGDSEARKGYRFVDRRALLRLAGTAAIAAPATGLLAACGGSKGPSGVRPVRIGVVTPQSGALSAFSKTDLFVVDYMNSWFKSQGGIAVGNSTHPVTISVRDSQSTFARAAKATTQLIYEDDVDIVLVGATSETVNPVADQCEIAGVPCVSTMAPWESWYYPRGGLPTLKTAFTWTYHFFAGLADYYAAFAAMWGELPTNRSVGALWPSDIDGKLFANQALPFRQGLDTNWKLANPNIQGTASPYLYQPGIASFSNIIGAFQRANVQIVTGILSEADFAQFERDSSAAVFEPKLVTISKAAMFSGDLTSIGAGASDNLTTELFWSTSNPNRSFVTNLPARDLADKYSSTAPGGQTDAPQQLGSSMALFDVAAQALSAVSSIDDRKSIAAALKSLTARTIMGEVKFGARENLPPNVATVALNGGQWKWHPDSFTWQLAQVNNSGNNALPNQSELTPMKYDV